YTYSLFFEAALVASNGTGLFTLLPPGDYYLVVNDNAPCEFSTTVTVPPATVCTAAETPTIIQYDPIICPGEDLFLTVNGSALNDNTDWYWYEGSCGGTPIETGANLYIPLATNTTYYVRGEGGCVQTGACASIAITPLSPPNISFNVSATDITCSGAEDGTISILNATGGAPGVDGYTYTVSDGESYFSNHTGLFTGLWSSSYFVQVTDTSVCGLQDTVDYFISEPDPIAMTINLAANSCYGQDVTGFIAVTGGTLPYTGDGAFNLGALAPTDSVLGFLVSDANGCQQVDSVVFSQPSALVLDGVTDSTIVCLEFSTTGELTLTPSGGTAPYTITGDATTGLVDGTYHYTLTDNNGCVLNKTTEVFVTNCILPYYNAPDSGKVNTALGPELVQLYNDPDSIGPQNNNVVFQLDGFGSVFIDVIANIGQYDALLNLLQTPQYGMTGIIDNGDTTLIITGYYPIDNLPLLDSIPSLVNFVRPNYAPVSSAGLINSQGDRAMKSDSARVLFDLDGSGIKVGVISDSYNKLAGNPAGLDISNKDLPGPGNATNPTPVQVLLDYPYGAGLDEGRAMMQIVHDVAPKAELAFRTGFISAGDM
ncbi:MAG: hypothetical protein ACO1HD_02820, partial [Bacteroidota bacterium]